MSSKDEALNSEDSINVLEKLESLMSRDEIKLSGNYDSMGDDSSLNHDDGDVLNLQHKLSDNLDDDENKKAPDLSSLIKKQMVALQEDHLPDSVKNSSVIEGKTDDLSYDFSDTPRGESKVNNSGEGLEEWQEVIKSELKEFDEEGQSVADKGDNNVDLDMNFGLEEEKILDAYGSSDVDLNINNHHDPSDVFEKDKLNDQLVDEQVLSSKAYSETKEMFDQLKSTVNENADSKQKDSAANIEDFMIKMMKPMLKEWLDNNLPKIVKTVVQKEIKKLVE